METVSTSVELMVFIMACLYSDLEKKKKESIVISEKEWCKKKYLLQNDSHKSHCSANFYEIEGTQKPTQTKWMGFKISKCYVPPSEKKTFEPWISLIFQSPPVTIFFSKKCTKYSVIIVIWFLFVNEGSNKDRWVYKRQKIRC